MAGTSRFIARQAGAIGCAVLISAGSGSAQSAATSPKPASGGMFGGTSARGSASGNGLLLSVAEAYDDNVLGEAGTPVQDSLQEGGFFTDLNATLNLRTSGRKFQVFSGAGTNFRYYSDQQTTVGVGHYGSGGLSYTTTRTTFSIDGGLAYAPSYLYRLFANVAPTPPPVGDTAPGYAVTDTSSMSYDARAGLTEKLSPRSRLSFHAGGHYTNYLETPSRPALYGIRDLGTYEAGMVFSHSLNRNLNFNIGYTYRRAQYFTGAFPTEHDLIFGIDYDRPLSKTRRTHIRASASTATLDGIAPGDSSGLLHRQYKGTGDISVSRQFARTWQVAGAYRRGVDFIEGFATPTLTDGVSFNATGFLNRRVDLLMSASYSVGEPVVLGETKGYTTYAADVRVRRALNTRWAVYGEYLYYYYDFSRAFAPVGVPPTMSRSSVRVGLMLWVPTGGR